GVIPVMPIFLPGRIVLGAERTAREGALERAIAHGDLPAVAARNVFAGAAQALARRQRAPLDRDRRAPPARLAQPRISCSHLRSPAGWYWMIFISVARFDFVASIIAPRARSAPLLRSEATWGGVGSGGTPRPAGLRFAVAAAADRRARSARRST